MSGNFEVGDIVVCVDNAPDEHCRKAFVLGLGRVYRVAATGFCRGTPCVAFACHVGDNPGWGLAFQSRRFRLLPKADDTFVAEMRALRPRKAGAPA